MRSLDELNGKLKHGVIRGIEMLTHAEFKERVERLEHKAVEFWDELRSAPVCDDNEEADTNLAVAFTDFMCVVYCDDPVKISKVQRFLAAITDTSDEWPEIINQ